MNFDSIDWSEFPAPSADEWIRAIQQELGSKPIESILYHSPSGFSYQPFYITHPESSSINNCITRFQLHTHRNEWNIHIHIHSDNIHQEIQKALSYGAVSFSFTKLSPETCTHILLSLPSSSSVMLDYFSLTPPMTSPAEMYSQVMQSIPSSYSSVFFTFNPLEHALKNGTFHIEEKDLWQQWENLFLYPSSYPQVLLPIDSTLFQKSGANSITQLALILHELSFFFQKLEKSKESLSSLPSRLLIKVAVGPLFLEEIAKICALKLLLQQFFTVWEISPPLLPLIMAETSFRHQTYYEPYANLLRSTTEALAAVIAGVDYLHILPIPVETHNIQNAQRWAQNIHHLLRYESKLFHTINPLNGSYALEHLTHDIYHKAWEEFCRWEDQGSFCDNFKKSLIQEHILKEHHHEKQLFQQGKIKLTGINLYPDKKANVSLPPNEITTPVIDGKMTKKLVPVRIAAEEELSFHTQKT